MPDTLPIITSESQSAPTEPTDLLGLTFDELGALLAARGEPAFRARQLAGWIYGSLVGNFAAMRTLPAALRERLAAEATSPARACAPRCAHTTAAPASCCSSCATAA